MSKSKYAGLGYNAIADITALPIKSRRRIGIGRGGAVIKPRCHHLVDTKLEALRTAFKETGVVPNPFNKGNYHFIFAALVELGLNVEHKYAAFQTKVRQLMSASSTKDEAGLTAWERFRDKEMRNGETGLDAYDRIEQNVRVLQRFGGFNPYGLKINEVGTKVCRFKGLVIDLLKSEDGEISIRLNSESNEPINQLKVRGVDTEEVAPAPKPRKRKPKAKKPVVEAPAADAPAEAGVQEEALATP